MSMTRPADRRWATALVTILVAACVIAAVPAAAPSRAAAATVVPQFSVTAKLAAQRRDGHRVLVMTRVRIAGIRGSLRIGCSKCLRLEGQIRRTKGRNRSITMSGVNWILTARRSVLVSVVKAGKVGRFVRLGVSTSSRSRLIYKASGCMTSRRSVRSCPDGTQTITPGQAVGRLGSATKPRMTTVSATGATPQQPGPTTPDALTISATSASSITVSWGASTSPAGIYSYTVYLNGAPITLIEGLSYTFSGLPCSAAYTVGVSATDQSGNVSPRVDIDTATQGCPAPPPTFTATRNETVGKQTTGARTWTDYTKAGGPEGQLIGPGETIAVSCRIEGLAAQDGNTWWYRIASGPWNGLFYVSADAFYNNGTTDGPLGGTPFYDPEVPIC